MCRPGACPSSWGLTGEVPRTCPAWVEAEGLEAAGLRVDVAYGGAFYASVESPLPVEPASLTRLIELGREVKRELEAQREFVVPDAPDIRDVYGVIFWQDEGESSGALVQRNVTVFADGEVDRSPCGSGTSARLALLHARRRDRARAASCSTGASSARSSGPSWSWRCEEHGRAGRRRPRSRASAHLTGHHEFVLEPDDELGTGFLLR